MCLGYQVLFIPKSDCELNPIERVWDQAKVYTRKFTNFSLILLRKVLNPALDSVSTDTIIKTSEDPRIRESLHRRKIGKKGDQSNGKTLQIT